MSTTTDIIERIEREMEQIQSNKVKKNRLLITCPECYLEDTLNQYFAGPAFWLTTLGGVIDMSDAFFIAQIEFAIRQYKIEEIDVVLSAHCQVLNKLKIEQHTERPVSRLDETLQNQLNTINEIPMVANYLEEGRISTKAFLYQEDTHQLREI